MRNFKKHFIAFGLIGVSALGFLGVKIFGAESVGFKYVAESGAGTQASFTVVETVAEKKKPVVHLKTPESVKGIYMTSCVAGTPSFRKKLVDLVDTTELNTIVIDIKDYTGMLSFVPTDSALKDYLSNRCYAPDMKEFVASLHEKGIYVVGRITVFQDPFLAKKHPELGVKKLSDKNVLWADRKGINFVDVGAKGVWEHVIAISKESYALGFDELNYDYIRFPSDGNMKDIYFPYSVGRIKSEVLEEFFAYLQNNLKNTGVVLSADLFGMTTTNTDDLNIGQQLEKTLPYFDFVAPMVYPSHYPSGFNNWKDVNAHPYDIVYYAMSTAVNRALATTTPVKTIGSEQVSVSTTTPILYTKEVHDKLKLRPWLQDNDYPIHYTPAMVRAQIKATYDAGLTSWMLWDAGNTYTQAALDKEQ